MAARNAGFTVSDDLTVTDTRIQTTTAEHLARQSQAPKLAHGIWSSAMGLAETDRSVAGRLTPTAAGFQGLTFREGRAAADAAAPAGNSTLFCGNDKFGLKHMCKKGHDSKWSDYIGGLSAGNWRYGADYAISAALAYPETVTYRQDNDTFLVTRVMRTEDQGIPIWQANVVVSASDGRIVGAYPANVKR